MKRWRPEGWRTDKTVLILPQGTEPQTTICRCCAYRVCQAEYSYEAGADAMLKALKDTSIISDEVETICQKETDGGYDTLVVKFPTLQCMRKTQKTKGNWVFIPEEE